MIRSICRRLWLWMLPLALLLPACTTTKLPPSAPPAVEVKVPVPVPCQIEKVPVPDYPAAQARAGMGVYDLTKLALADRRVRMAENERLRAAINAPCTDAVGQPH